MQINNISCVQLMAQPLTFNLNQPPMVPNIPVHALPPQVQPFLIPLSAAVANKLSQCVLGQDGIPPHPGRVYVFNAASMGQYNNQYFGALVASAIDIMFWMIMRNPHANPEALMYDAASSAVSAEVSRMLVNTPGIQHMVDQQIMMEARHLLSQHGQVQMEITNLKNRVMPQTAQPHHVNYGGNAIYTSGGGNMGGSHQRYQGQPQQTMMAGGNNPMFGSSSNPGTHQTMQTTNTPARGSSLPYLEESQMQKQQQMRPQQMQQPNVVQQTLVTVKDWRPSNIQAYPSAYYESTHKAVLEQAMDSVTSTPCYVIRIVQKDEQEMERSQHQLSQPSRTHAHAVNSALSKSGQDFDALLGSNLSESIETLQKHLPEYQSVKNVLTTKNSPTNRLGLASNLFEAIFAAQYKLQSAFRNNILFKAYTNFTILNKTHVSSHNFRVIIEAISQADTLAEVAKILTTAMDQGRDQHTLAQFIETVDQFLCKEYNNFLHTRLSLGNVSLGSFVEDAPAIIKYIRDKRGDVYGDILANSQKTFIQSTVYERFVDEENHQFFTAAMIPEDEAIEDTPETLEDVSNADRILTHMPQIISVTAVGVKASDLDIGHLPGVGNMITTENFPALTKFARQLFRTTTNLDAPIAHHYLVTQDKHVFELTEGMIGTGVILITKREITFD